MTNLPYIIFWIATATFLIASPLLCYSLIRAQHRSANDTEPEQSFHHNGVLEMIWTLVPVGLLVLLMTLTFQTM